MSSAKWRLFRLGLNVLTRAIKAGIQQPDISSTVCDGVSKFPYDISQIYSSSMKFSALVTENTQWHIN